MLLLYRDFSTRARTRGEAFACNVRQKNHSSRELAALLAARTYTRYTYAGRPESSDMIHFSLFFFPPACSSCLPAHPLFFHWTRHTRSLSLSLFLSISPLLSFSFSLSLFDVHGHRAICKPNTKYTLSVGSGMPHNRPSLIRRAHAAFEGHVLTYALNPFVAKIAWDEWSRWS